MTCATEHSDGVYLLHFDEPYQHARHYLGWSNDVDRRVGHHLAGRGHNPLVDAVLAAGITIRLARVFEGADRTFESRLKKAGKSRICPMCTDHPRNPRSAA